MQRRVFTRLLVLLVLFALIVPAVAEAGMNLRLTNKTSRKVSLALRYKDNVSGEWVTQGWWSCDPLSVKNITLNTNNKVIYFYASAGNSVWGGKQGSQDANKLGIVGSKFLVKSKHKPQGNNYREVWFKQLKANNGVFALTLSGK